MLLQKQYNYRDIIFVQLINSEAVATFLDILVAESKRISEISIKWPVVIKQLDMIIN